MVTCTMLSDSVCQHLASQMKPLGAVCCLEVNCCQHRDCEVSQHAEDGWSALEYSIICIYFTVIAVLIDDTYCIPANDCLVLFNVIHELILFSLFLLDVVGEWHQWDPGWWNGPGKDHPMHRSYRYDVRKESNGPVSGRGPPLHFAQLDQWI